MSKVIVICNVTLDGVMQAPGRPDEDDRGGFVHGGWGGALQRRCDGPGDGRRDGPRCGDAARPTDLRGFRRRLAAAA